MKKFTRNLLKTIGWVLILVGIVAAYFAPLEIYVFYLFSAGGTLYNEGFGVGSFWFAVLVVMNIGYYAIAAICLPAGIGHVKLRRWGYTLTHLYLWFWLGAGIWLAASLILLIPPVLELDLSREVLFMRMALASVAAIIFLILTPLLVLRFYRGEKVRAVFEQHDPDQYWTERTPFLILALLLLYLILIIALHAAIFFQVIFPMFGLILLGRQSVPWISLCILILGVLMYGTARLKRWAWWGAVVFFSVLTFSTALSFGRYRFYDIILRMDLPAYEMEFLDRMVLLHDYRLVVLLAGPLLAALGLVIASKRYFRKD